MADDAISDFLDIEDMEAEPRTLVPAPKEKGVPANAQDDYEQVRHNLLQVTEDASAAIDKLLTLAKQSESPRAYEVLATYLKTQADVNGQLMDLHKQRLEVDVEARKVTGDSPESPGEIHNTNVFVGSTEELQKYLENR